MKSLFVSAFALLSAAALAQIPDDVSLVPVAGISGLQAPLGLKHAGDGSGRIFIVEQGGTVRIIDAVDNLLSTPFIDVGSLITNSGEQGLLDIAFHPEYAIPGAAGEGLFYLHFSSGGSSIPDTEPGDTVIAEFSVGNDADVANPDYERIILTVSQDDNNHNGGQMQFSAKGYLYIGLGDGGGAGDPCERAQTLNPGELVEPDTCGSDATLNDSLALLGKMLRIDVDSTTAAVDNDNLCGVGAGNAAQYAVPASNPFAGPADRCGEVFLYGLRNPWRFSFDRATGDLWIGDVGQNQWEEIDLLAAPLTGGDNLGWDCYEASSVFETAGCPDAGELVFPVLEYPRAEADCSVTGGYRYRGPVLGLQGLYLFGDYCSGDIRVADDDSGAWSAETIARFDVGFGLRSFGEDEAGNLYVIAGDGLHRFEGDVDQLIFADGFEN